MKNKFFYRLVLTICLLLNHTAFANTAEQLTATINQIISNAPQDVDVAVIVENPETGQILYQNNPDRLFVPASNMKLFTAYAALKILGPNYTFDTTIYANPAQIKNGILDGNVYLTFSADPTLTFAELNNLVAALSKAGIKQINGKFIVVDHSFDQVDFGTGWMWDDIPYCEGQGVHGMIVNHNCFVASFSSGARVGEPASYKFLGTQIPFPIINQALTGSPTTNCQLYVTSNDQGYTVQGCINQSNSPQEISFGITDPNFYVSELLKIALRDNNIFLTSPIQFGELNPTTPSLATDHSQPLSVILGKMLKPSDNLYANVLFKKIGQTASNGIGTWENSQKAMQHLLQSQLRIDPHSYVIVDGSGTSRYDLVSANQILAVLKAVYQDPTLASTFIPALPVGGIDGTLAYRMTTPGMRGRVMAKTGSMTGISSLSGYIKTVNNHTLIFVILTNNFSGSDNLYRHLQDKICEAIAEL